MLLYSLIIIISMSLISLFNILFGSVYFGYSPFSVICMVCLSTLVEIIIQGISAGIIHALPDRFFDHNSNLFRVSKKECRLYEKFGIRLWKDKILELGIITGFRKNKLASPNNSEYIGRFIIEANKGMLGHIVGIILGFLNFLILPIKYAIVISLPVAIVGFILGLLPIFVLRYNLPKLNIAYARAIRLENR